MASIFDFQERARARYNPPYRPPEPTALEKILQTVLAGLNAWQSVEGIRTQRAAREGMAASTEAEAARTAAAGQVTPAQTQTELARLLGENWDFGPPEARRQYTDIPGSGEGALQRYPIEGIREPRAALRETLPVPQLSEGAGIQEMKEKDWLRRPELGPAPRGYAAWGDRLVRQAPSGPPPEGYTPWGGELYKTGMTPGEREEIALRNQGGVAVGGVKPGDRSLIMGRIEDAAEAQMAREHPEAVDPTSGRVYQWTDEMRERYDEIVRDKMAEYPELSGGLDRLVGMATAILSGQATREQVAAMLSASELLVLDLLIAEHRGMGEAGGWTPPSLAPTTEAAAGAYLPSYPEARFGR